MRFRDVSGVRFGRLTAIRTDGKSGSSTVWLCHCDCGKHTRVAIFNLTNGHSKSCGCLRVIIGRKVATTHGLRKHPYYTIWSKMRQRCTNPADPAWKYYGGRGITVCRRWENFANFVRDMGHRPPATSLDRKNNDGNYCPQNCRWATQKEQMRNSRKATLITFRGKTQTIAEWAEETGINRQTLRDRLRRYGWPVEKALQPRGVSSHSWTPCCRRSLAR